ncbi:MAG: vWA domain-containing protein [Candidatus Riflebacteria bacterium]
MRSILTLLGFDLGPIRSLDSLNLALSWGWAGLVLTLLALMPLSWYLYRFEDRQVSRRDRLALLGLRATFIFLVALLLCGPVLLVSGWVPQKNKIAVMVDGSRSMSIGSEGDTRLDRIAKVFSQKKLLDRLQEKTGIMPDLFSFAENVSPLSLQEIEQFNVKAVGNQTDISAAARNIAGNLGDGSLLGLVMLTDGVSTDGENPAIALPNLRTPIYFVGPGGIEKGVDLAISIPKPPATGYLNSNVRVRGEISRYGNTADNLKIAVTRDGKPFTEIDGVFTGNRGNFALNIPCDEEGSYRFELAIPELPGEITNENNRVSFLLKVVRERLNILAISGEPSWDTKFILNAVLTDPNARMVAWTRLKDDRWVCNRELKPQAGVRQPDFATDLKDADVLLLRGVSYNFIRSLAPEIVRRLESGNLGLLWLPGFSTLTSFGYAGSELESLLPVKLEREEWRGTPGNMVLAGETSYNFLKLADDPIENVEFFATLPKFEGLFEFSAIKPGAEILVSTTVRSGPDPLPFMLRSRAGQGNVIFVTGGPLWPAGFRLVPSDRGFAPYAALMVNMLKWLANRREDANVSIELPASRGYVGQPLNVKVWVSDARHQLQSGAQVSVEIENEKNEKTSLSCIETSEKGCYEASLVPAYRGLHKIQAKARYQGNDLGSANAELIVEAPTAEFENPQVSLDLMKQIASETAGIYCNADDIEPLVSAIDAVPGQKLESRIIDLRDSWVLLALLLLLPLAEWYWRRVRGLS